MNESMTHWERIEAALKGDAVDRPPVSLWRHWPGEDDTAEGLAAATVRWQGAYDFDLVKFMPTGTFSVEDWGAVTTYTHNLVGTRTITAHGLTAEKDWPRLEALDVTKGSLGRQNEALRLTAEALADSVPILQTVFSPLTTARKLAGDRVFTHMRRHPDILKEGLKIIAETTARFALAALACGACGVFLASQCKHPTACSASPHIASSASPSTASSWMLSNPIRASTWSTPTARTSCSIFWPPIRCR